jgi:Ca-activated chloride channel family protein
MSLRRGFSKLLSLVLLACACTARASEAPESPDDRTLSPYFFVEGGDDGVDRLPLLGTQVHVEIAGVIAHVTVRQTYKNDGARPIHALYVFPASTRAAVHGLTMTVGEQLVRAKIREREQAKREYQAAKQAGKNAALLEQQRPNVFTMELANVVPGQRIDVELSYSELLVPTAGVYEFVYPTVVGPRYSSTPAATAPESDRWVHAPYLHQQQPPPHALELSGTLVAGMPIHALECPSHVIHAEWTDSSRVGFELDPSERAGANRDFIIRYRLEGDAIQSGLMLYRGADEDFFLLMVQPPRRVEVEAIPPREYVFVLDVSGSMDGYPLETAKQLVRDLIAHLRPSDRFNLLTFAGNSQLWSPRSLSATRANVDDALGMLGRLQAGGGTELLAAVQRAMALPGDDEARSRSIVIVTDGYISAERDVFDYIRGNLGRANVFAFGIGTSVNRYLIEGLARAGQGEPFVVTEASQARATSARFREYVQYPLLTGIQLGFDGFEAYDVEPAAIPDVMADRPILIQGKWRGERRGRITLTGATGAGRFTRTVDVAEVRPDAAHRALRELWARTRVAELSDWSGAGESESDQRRIAELGLTYDLLTKYTSFVAVHEVVRNPSGSGDDVTQALPLPAGVSDAAVGGVGMGMGDEPGLAWLIAAAGALGCFTMWRAGRAAGAAGAPAESGSGRPVP